MMMDPRMNGAFSKGCRDGGAALLLLLEVPLVAVLDAPEATAVTDPEPGVAVPVDVPPAFWLPFPERPRPAPAPFLMNCYQVSIV